MTTTQKPKQQAILIGVDSVAAMLSYSTRQIYRLADGGRMPRPLKIGNSNRWVKSEIEEWILQGCPPTIRHDG